MELSPTMKRAVEFALANNRKLTRHPGGFWMGEVFAQHGTSFGAKTVEALTNRGLMRYTAWQEGRTYRFPIEAELTELVPN